MRKGKVGNRGKSGNVGDGFYVGKSGNVRNRPYIGKVAENRKLANVGKLAGFCFALTAKIANIGKIRKAVLMIMLIGLLSFAGGVYAANALMAKTDWEWAQSAGYVSAAAEPEQAITQAQFLQMVMTEYDAKEKGVFVPKGAENHWAAEYYATAKKEGLIDCSCQIKPDGPVTVEEAAKFVMVGINRKANDKLVDLEEVEGWIIGKDSKESMANGDAAVMLRKMSELLKKAKLLE